MSKQIIQISLMVGLVFTYLVSSVEARVVRFVVERTTPYADGTVFGEAGAFERLEGTVFMEVDPTDPLNAVIVNIDRAPRNAEGLVEFHAPFVLIKPVDMARGNGKLVYGINNRGNMIELTFHNFPPQPSGASADAGDGFLFGQGYAFVDAGWAGDIVTTETRLGAVLPVATQADGSAIVSTIRIEYTGDGYTLPLKGNDRFRSYETANTDTRASRLTVRHAIGGARIAIAADQWAFGSCSSGRPSLVSSTTDICVFDGFQPDQIYELSYPAKNPWVMGLGYAVTRDVAAFLRHERADDDGNPNPLVIDGAGVVRRAYGLGISSTGMYMRDFLYLGFNEDEAHRQVFDGVRIQIAGTHRLLANVEFADPNVYSRQDQHPDFTSHSIPPLTYAVTIDPISGVRDGILKRPETDPFVFHIDSANEFWHMNASLNVHDGLGNPVPVPDNVRLYSVAGHSHVGGSGVGARPTARGTCANVTNGYFSYAPVMRALLVALDAWVDGGVEPPASDYPDVRNGTLTTLAVAASEFPSIPGVTFPTVVNGLTSFDFGPLFGSRGGRVTVLPPVRGRSYRVLVPMPDQDGHDLAGIRTVDVAAPVGTNTGWNLRAEGPRGQDLCGLSGSFIPFETTRADRIVNGDPRLSLEERYGDHDGFVEAVRRAAEWSVSQRVLLEGDVATIVALAEASDILVP
jgi:hypothetical protein